MVHGGIVIKNPFIYILDLFYPPLCPGCGNVLEDAALVVCQECRNSLPLTEHAVYPDNKVSGLFTDINKVEKAAAFCHYDHDTAFYRMIHALKYYRQPQIGVWLGKEAARHLMSGNPQWFSGIDVIVPIPLQKKRLRQRRYNQSELIAEGICKETGIAVDTRHLLRVVNNPTQTQRTTDERRANTEGIFALRYGEELRGKHILLVDDIVTTGSTLRSALSVLTPVRGLHVSILTMGEAGK